MQVYSITDDVLSPVLYGMSDNTMTNYFRDKIDRVKSYITSDSYFVSDYNKSEYRYSDEYIKNVKKSLYDLELAGSDEETLYYYKDSREANLATIEWIMANKKISRLYDRGLVNGYSESKYVHNKYSAEVKYMSVMDGYMEDGDEDFITEYYNPDMEEVSRDDRKIILSNWEKALDMYNKNIDPTNK